MALASAIHVSSSSAALKAFVGEHGGAVCTSSNARAILDWALAKGSKVLFFPDQHLGRNTGFDMGYDASDMRGYSFKLARFAADNNAATDIVFCGVHFMAESADVLTGDHQRVILPDLNAGCSMADMADIDEVTEAWEELARVTDIERVVPITYMNSSAAKRASLKLSPMLSAQRMTSSRW